MSEEIIKILDDLGQRFGVAIDWTNQNVLPYVQELMQRFVNFRNAQAIFWIVISLVVIVLSIVAIVKSIKWLKKNNYDSYDDEFFATTFLWIFGGLAILTFLIVGLSNINGLIQNIFLPELTILEYLQAF